MDAVETAFARNAIGWAMDVTCEGATATLTCCSDTIYEVTDPGWNFHEVAQNAIRGATATVGA